MPGPLRGAFKLNKYPSLVWVFLIAVIPVVLIACDREKGRNPNLDYQDSNNTDRQPPIESQHNKTVTDRDTLCPPSDQIIELDAIQRIKRAFSQNTPMYHFLETVEKKLRANPHVRADNIIVIFDDKNWKRIPPGLTSYEKLRSNEYVWRGFLQILAEHEKIDVNELHNILTDEQLRAEHHNIIAMTIRLSGWLQRRELIPDLLRLIVFSESTFDPEFVSIKALGKIAEKYPKDVMIPLVQGIYGEHNDEMLNSDDVILQTMMSCNKTLAEIKQYLESEFLSFEQDEDKRNKLRSFIDKYFVLPKQE